MKAYVIKNKQGKYYRQYFYNGYVDFVDDVVFCETNNLYDAKLFDTREEALKCCPKNCEVVEITIAEGNLEQQLERKDKEIGNLIRRLMATEYKGEEKK